MSEHGTVAEAFAALDRLAEQAHLTGASIEAIELLVVDAEGRVVARPGARH